MPGTPRRFSLALASVAVAALTLVTGCSSSSSSTAPTTTVAASSGSGPGKPCKAAAAPTGGAPAVEMPKQAPDKLISTDLKVGTGAEAKVGEQITVNYVGVSCSTGMKFDSSYDRGEPATFGLVQGGLIQGWVDGIPGMKVGGQRLLVIPPALGYGDRSPGPEILPGETLVFVVELVAVGGPA